MIKKSIINLILLLIFVFIFSNPVSAGRSWEYYYNNGLEEYKFRNYNEAEYFFLKALKINNTLYEACNRLAEIYSQRNKKAEAIEYYRKSLEIKDTQPEIHCTLGELYEFFLTFDKSYTHYKKAIEYDPNHIKSNYNLVRYYIRTNDPVNTKKYFEICNKLGKPAGDEYYKKGVEQAEKKNLNKAIELFLLAVKENPVMVEALYAVSEIYRKERDYENAIFYMEKINEIKPEYKNINIHLGYLYFNASLKYRGPSGEIKKRKYLLRHAVRNIELAIKNEPDNSELHILLSQAFKHLGEDDKAFNAMQKAVEIEDAGQ